MSGVGCRALYIIIYIREGRRLVAGWLPMVAGGCFPHVGRFSVVLSHLVGVSVASDGVPRCREGVAVALQVSGVLLLMSGGCRG